MKSIKLCLLFAGFLFLTNIMAQDQHGPVIITNEDEEEYELMDWYFSYWVAAGENLDTIKWSHINKDSRDLHLKESYKEDSTTKTKDLMVTSGDLSTIHFKWMPGEEVICKEVILVMKDGTKKVLPNLMPASSFLSQKKYIAFPGLFLIGKENDREVKFWLAGYTFGKYGFPKKRKLHEIQFP